MYEAWERGKRENETILAFLEGPLSNFWPAPITIDGIEYPTNEHYFMAKKANYFRDFPTERKIMGVSSPMAAKRLGREVKPYSEAEWSQVRYEFMRIANVVKYKTHKDLRERLLSTKGKILVEANWEDYIWGVGLRKTDNAIFNPSKWKGTNFLGLILMEVRAICLFWEFEDVCREMGVQV